MATQTQILLFDDLDGAAGKETPADESLTLALNGQAVELDLTTKHADKLRGILAPYLDAGRKAQPLARRANGRANGQAGRAPGGRGSAEQRAYNAALRAFGDANGISYRTPSGQPYYSAALRKAYAEATG